MSRRADDPLATRWPLPPTLRAQLDEGQAVRERVPRESLSQLVTTDRDPMAILDEQDVRRVRDLVPIRTERMAASPFAFYRGTAALMAADLGRSPSTELTVGSCGDAHVANFGLYASPQRSLAFDLNDFDEAAWAPWEWDVKRLVASIVIAGQATSRDEDVVTDAALSAVRTYARSLRAGAERSPLSRYFDHFDADIARESADKETAQAIASAIKDAEKRTGERAARKLTHLGADGRLEFVDAPPTMTHVDAMFERRVVEVFDDYVASAKVDIRVLLAKYAVVDLALRVVGVGSVGTRCFLLALQDGDGRALILQAKEAGQSVLIQYGNVAQPPPVQRYLDANADGGRVVAMQRVLQAVSDPFLGHISGRAADVDEVRSFYLRQFHDKKGGFDMESLEDRPFRWYAEACAATLARAHGQSPSAGVVSGYVGGGRVVGEAILEWAHAYAAVSKKDWELFRTHRGVES